MFAACVPACLRVVSNLSAILEKADAHATARKIDPAALLQARLYPDMFAFTRQVQTAGDFAKGTPARLAGVEVPSYPDTESSFAELKQRLAKTEQFVRGFAPEQIDGSEAHTVTIKQGSRELSFPGLDYLLIFALPNLYFHAAAAYAILRHNGVELGKRDFIGAI